VVAPVITSDGSTVIVCGDGSLWSVSAGGAVRFEVDLQMRTKKTQAAPLARDDGGVVVATDDSLALVAADGEIGARAQLQGRAVGGLIPWRGGVLATLRSGVVQHWRPPAAPRKVGDLGGTLDDGAVLVSERTLVAVVDRQRVVGLDLLGGGGTLITGAAGTGAQLEGPPTLDKTGVLLVSNVLGELFGVDAHGVLVRRLALENLPLMFNPDAGVGALLGRVESRPSPAMIVGTAGRVGFARNSGKIGIVEPDGSGVVTVNPRLCARPLAVLPAGDNRMLVACHSGSVAMFSAGSSP
jgi:outer membrane protein assembly factor BamB